MLPNLKTTGFQREKIEKQSRKRQKKKKPLLEELTSETSLKELFLKTEPLSREDHTHPRSGDLGWMKITSELELSNNIAVRRRNLSVYSAPSRFLSFFLPIIATLFFSFPFPKFYAHLDLMYQVLPLEIYLSCMVLPLTCQLIAA